LRLNNLKKMAKLSSQLKESPVRKITSLIIIISMFAFASFAFAEDGKIAGTLSTLELSKDGKSATTVLKDSKTGESVTIIVTDEQTLDKFKDKRIVEGDEIRSKFEKKDGKNKSKIFKKTAGC